MTNKTLEELSNELASKLNEITDYLCSYEIAQVVNEYTAKVHTAALDACREKMPNELKNTKEDSDSDWFFGSGYNSCRSEIITAIDSLRPLEGKE